MNEALLRELESELTELEELMHKRFEILRRLILVAVGDYKPPLRKKTFTSFNGKTIEIIPKPLSEEDGK